jgi:hypothetical protein
MWLLVRPALCCSEFVFWPIWIRSRHLPADSGALAKLEGQRTATAQKAFREKDVQLSRLAHELSMAPERHMTESGQYIKAAVFGGLDGIITTFAVVASVTGANLATGVVIIMVRRRRSLLLPVLSLPASDDAGGLRGSGVCQPPGGRHLDGHGRVPFRLVGNTVHTFRASARGVGV